MAGSGNDLTTNGELLDQLVNSAARGNRIALEALEVRYGIVIVAAIRARVLKQQHRFIDAKLAWEVAAKAVRRLATADIGEQAPFLAWLGFAADEAATVQVSTPGRAGKHDDDGLEDADRCALELHVMGYGSTQIAEVLGESKSAVKDRIENAKQLMLARAMATSDD